MGRDGLDDIGQESVSERFRTRNFSLILKIKKSSLECAHSYYAHGK